MAVKSVAVLFFVLVGCLAAPAAEDEAPSTPISEEVTTTDHLHGDLDDILQHISQTSGDRSRRDTKSTDKGGKECVKKSGRKGTCVLYFQCKENEDDGDTEGNVCPSYVETCCLDSSRQVDLSTLVDIW